LRDYGVGGQIGLEPTWREYVQRLVGVLREVKRTLKPEGSLWIVLGDTFAGSDCSWGKRRWHQKQDVQGRDAGYPADRPPAVVTGYDNVTVPKQKLGIPFRVRFALMEHGWICRNDVVWHKPNHMPDSVKDRLTCSWEWWPPYEVAAVLLQP
jgi:DNA modification methylase